MRALAPLLILASVCMANAAMAQTTETPGTTPVVRVYAVEGDAPRFCAVGTPTLSTTVNNNIRSLTGGVVTIDTLADPTTLTTRAAQFGILLDAVCNYAHRLTITSENNGLWRDPVAGVTPAGFAGAIPYRATVDWAGDETILDAEAESRREQAETALVSLPYAGNVLIDVAITAGATNKATNTPLLAGTYRDTIRVTIEPQ